MSIKSEILGIAREHGFEGNAQTITGAINALTDTLAGEDVQGGRTVASAISKLAPYIGAGGGGGITIGASFILSARQSSTALPVKVIMAWEGNYPPSINLFGSTNAQQTLMLPSGLEYSVGIEASSVSSVTIAKQGGEPQSIEFQTMTQQGILLVHFLVPVISLDDGYTPSHSAAYTLTIEA